MNRTNNLRIAGVNAVNSDDIVSESSEELRSVGAPGQSSACVVFGSVGGLFLLWLFDDQLGNWIIRVRVQIEDLDTVFTSGGDPLLDGVEADLVDGGTSVEGSVFFVQVVQVPDLEGVFLTTSGDVSAQRSNGEGVDVFLVSLEGVLDQEVGLPDLKSAVPADSGEVGVLGNRGVSDAGDPVGMVVVLVGVLAVSKSVPELEGLISTSGDDLSVIEGEAD